jgi:23S rRNA (cytidine1920-2'-O)/16S rRNA (cytidine1409-2'-O)-methyltransferase
MALRRPSDRLDRILVSRGLAENRSRAQALVLAGRVTCRGVRLEKPGVRLAVDAPLEVRPGRRYVSRGGHKLAAALDCFAIEPAGRVALDVGASTGGFTQVLLEHGARSVIALDVGRGQLDWSLRQDRRVHPLEGVNARYLEPAFLPAVPSLAVIDVSFISTELVLPAVVGCLSPDGEVATLIKPQFEVGRGHVGRGGIVRNPELHREVLERAARFSRVQGWGVCGLCASPLPGAEGNREFFIHLRPSERGLEKRELTDQLARALAGEATPQPPRGGGAA